MTWNYSVKQYGAVLFLLVTTSACAGELQARPRFEVGGIANPDQRYPFTMDVRGWKEPAKRAAPFRAHRSHLHRRAGRAGAAAAPAGRVARARPAARLSLAQIAPVLARKVGDIVSTCHAHVISALRHTFVAGTHRVSLHASGKAVDVQGNPSCIYAMLHGWPGGYSVDYARVRHVHISYEPHGREWGARFVHGGGRRYVRHGRRGSMS